MSNINTIQVKEVQSKKELKTFIYLPEKIHKNHVNWLHPLYIDEKKFFNAERNPFFEKNKTALFLAYKKNRPVGRIMAIIPIQYNQEKNKNSVRFSYMECEEDYAIFNALIDAVVQWSKPYGSNEIIGPMGFSDKEPQGFVTKGFHESTMMVTNCTYPYMIDFTQQKGFTSMVKLHEYEVPINQNIIDRYDKFVERVMRNHDIKTLEFTSTKDIKPYVADVFNLINVTYQEIYGFTEVSEAERDEFANRFLPLLNPRLVKILADENNRVLAFIVAMPDISSGIRKAKGRLFPFGWYHLFRSFKKSKRLVLLLGGVHPSIQNKGLDSILAIQLFKSAIRLGFKTMDSHLIMKDNKKMIGEIERLEGHRLTKEYTIFRKEIS